MFNRSTQKLLSLTRPMLRQQHLVNKSTTSIYKQPQYFPQSTIQPFNNQNYISTPCQRLFGSGLIKPSSSMVDMSPRQFHSSTNAAEVQSDQQLSIDQDIPIIDVQKYLKKEQGWEEECTKVAESFHKFGILRFRDPRVNIEANEKYIDLVERYFDSVSKQHYAGEELKDCRPDLHFQTGVTPESQEKARNHKNLVSSLSDKDQVHSVQPPTPDAKWRFFWKMGDRPKEIEDTIPQTIPEDFPEWEQEMNTWGTHMIDSCFTAAEMCAIGMGLEKDTFTERMKLGPHLLAPTASDLTKYDVGTNFAGFHYDLNFITIHGKSRYPGLFLWTRNMKRFSAVVPNGCLLLQAGIMLEQITGGYIKAGYHEVIYTEKTKEVVDQKKKENAAGANNILWRISSTLFSHLRYDVDLSPLESIKHKWDKEAVASGKYPTQTAHQRLMYELEACNLAKTD